MASESPKCQVLKRQDRVNKATIEEREVALCRESKREHRSYWAHPRCI